MSHVSLLSLILVPSVLKMLSASAMLLPGGPLISTKDLWQSLPRLENAVQVNAGMSEATILMSAYEYEPAAGLAAAVAAVEAKAAAAAAAEVAPVVAVIAVAAVVLAG